MIDGLYLPPKPAIILSRPKEIVRLARVPEKWTPVFRKEDAPTHESGAHPDSIQSGCALGDPRFIVPAVIGGLGVGALCGGSGGPSAWVDCVASIAGSENGVTWDGYGVRTAFASGALLATGTITRVKLMPPSTGVNLVLSAVWIGMANSAPNFDGNQVQLKFNGSAGVTLAAGGSPVVSDPANFQPNLSGTVLVSMGIATGDVRRQLGLGANYIHYFKAADAANAGATTVSGYSASSSGVDFTVKQIEVFV